MKGVVPHTVSFTPEQSSHFPESSGARAVGSFQIIKGVTQKIRRSRWGYFLESCVHPSLPFFSSDKPSGVTIVDIATRRMLGCQSWRASVALLPPWQIRYLETVCYIDKLFQKMSKLISRPLKSIYASSHGLSRCNSWLFEKESES